MPHDVLFTSYLFMRAALNEREKKVQNHVIKVIALRYYIVPQTMTLNQYIPIFFNINHI